MQDLYDEELSWFGRHAKTARRRLLLAANELNRIWYTYHDTIPLKFREMVCSAINLTIEKVDEPQTNLCVELYKVFRKMPNLPVTCPQLHRAVYSMYRAVIFEHASRQSGYPLVYSFGQYDSFLTYLRLYEQGMRMTYSNDKTLQEQRAERLWLYQELPDWSFTWETTNAKALAETIYCTHDIATTIAGQCCNSKMGTPSLVNTNLLTQR